MRDGCAAGCSAEEERSSPTAIGRRGRHQYVFADVEIDWPVVTLKSPTELRGNAPCRATSNRGPGIGPGAGSLAGVISAASWSDHLLSSVALAIGLHRVKCAREGLAKPSEMIWASPMACWPRKIRSL